MLSKDDHTKVVTAVWPNGRDQETMFIECIRNENLAPVDSKTRMPNQEPTCKRKRISSPVFDDSFCADTDYVSILNLHLHKTRRPVSTDRPATYQECGWRFESVEGSHTCSLRPYFTMEVRICGSENWYRGLPQRTKKTANQSAAHVALQSLDADECID